MIIAHGSRRISMYWLLSAVMHTSASIKVSVPRGSSQNVTHSSFNRKRSLETFRVRDEFFLTEAALEKNDSLWFWAVQTNCARLI